MKTQKIFSILFFFAFTTTTVFAQNEYYTGLLFSEEQYKSVLKQSTLLGADYSNLPTSHSLKQYAPTPSSQGQHGTCTGWATAYAARTILEAQQNQWTDKNTITANAFSAAYLYHLIKDKDVINCSRGTHINQAMEILKTKGVAKHSDFPTLCATSIPDAIHLKASQFKIKDYTRLFNGDEAYEVKIKSIKKAISQNFPVVIGMAVPSSFQSAKGEWQPTESPSGGYGGHAMCIVGYDDTKYGGAFELQNSWGSNWGNAGYIWVSYKNFVNFAWYGFQPIPFDIPKPESYDLSGSLAIRLATGENIGVSKNGNSYKTNEAYLSGTRYRLYISNNEPAYVYTISSDLTGTIAQLFPADNSTSAALSYKANNIAIPNENYYIQMDNTIGKDYFCVLYSKEALNIEQIKQQIKQQNGSFLEKIQKAIPDLLVNFTTIDFENNRIAFKAKSKGKKVVALVVEMEHK